MLVAREYDFNDLYENSWSGAIFTLEIIIENDKEKELMEHLDMIFEGKIVDAVELNDYLWFESDYIFKILDIDLED